MFRQGKSCRNICHVFTESILQGRYGNAYFRFGGYRILGDLVCDIDDGNTEEDRKRLVSDTDSDAFNVLMKAYRRKSFSESYKDAVGGKCRELLDKIIKPSLAVRYVVTLEKRKLMWELLLDKMEKWVILSGETNG